MEGGWNVQGSITILNRLKRKDSVAGTDVWYKSVINNCTYKKDRISGVDGKVVSMGQEFTILIPFTGKYMPYNEWKNLEDKTGFFTISNQDVIILEDVEEEVTDKTIISVKQNHEPNTCEVRSIEQVIKRTGVNFEFRIGGV